MARRTFNRYYPLPVRQVSPQSLHHDHHTSLVDGAIGNRTTPLLCTADGEVLVGVPQLDRHLRLRPGSTIQVIELSGLSDDEMRALQGFDNLAPPLPSVQAVAIAALRKQRMPLRQIVECLPHVSDLSTISTLISLTLADPFLTKLIDNQRLSLQHAKQLFSLSRSDQRLWAGKVVAEKLSVAGLRSRLRDKAPAPDLQETIRGLEEALGTQATITMDASKGKILVSLAWTTVPELLGIMERIGAGPMPEAEISPGRPRALAIELGSNDEFDLLLGHLLPPG